jgi:hypothetical protein
MIDLIEESQRMLREVGCATVVFESDRYKALAFENLTVLGFIFAYESPLHLLQRWTADFNEAITKNQLGLRRAQAKAWNTYTIFLAQDVPQYTEMVALSAIEEDLRGTRKIARAGIKDGEDLRVALLPLLPIQNAPRLEAVDMKAEIRLRTTELPPRTVEAFLSDALETLIMQVLEEEP